LNIRKSKCTDSLMTLIKTIRFLTCKCQFTHQERSPKSLMKNVTCALKLILKIWESAHFVVWPLVKCAVVHKENIHRVTTMTGVIFVDYVIVSFGCGFIRRDKKMNSQKKKEKLNKKRKPITCAYKRQSVYKKKSKQRNKKLRFYWMKI